MKEHTLSNETDSSTLNFCKVYSSWGFTLILIFFGLQLLIESQVKPAEKQKICRQLQKVGKILLFGNLHYFHRSRHAYD